MSPTAWSGCACRSSRFWKVGPYMAHAGSLCMNLLYGFPGLQIGPGDPQSWAKFPVVLPEGWDGIEVERLWARSKPYRLIARHGAERAELVADKEA